MRVLKSAHQNSGFVKILAGCASMGKKYVKTNRPSAGESEEASFIFQHYRPSLKIAVDDINAVIRISCSPSILAAEDTVVKCNFLCKCTRKK